MSLTFAKASGHLEVTIPVAALGTVAKGQCPRVVVRDTATGDEVGTYTDPVNGDVFVVVRGPPEGGTYVIGLETGSSLASDCP